MKVEDILDQIDEEISNASTLPFSGGKIIIDAELLGNLIEDVRINLPQQLKQARNIVADRNAILDKAKREAEQLMNKVQDQIRALVAQDVIVKNAQEKANEILIEAQKKSKEMRQAANEYVDDLMKRADAMLMENLIELRSIGQQRKDEIGEVESRIDTYLSDNISTLRRARQNLNTPPSRTEDEPF